MPEPLEREVIFDIAPALSALGDLDNEFEQSARRVESLYSDAIASALSDVRIEDVDATPVETAISEAIEEGSATEAVVAADAAAVETGVAEAIVEGADDPAVIEADAAAVTEEITTAVDAADAEVTATAEAGGVTSEIENAITAVDTEIPVSADTALAESHISELEDFAENLNPEVTVSADTTQAESAFDSLGGTAAQSSVGVSALGAAAGSLTDDFVGLGSSGAAAEEGLEGAAGAAGKMSLGGLAAAAGVTAAVAGLVKFTQIGAEVIGIQQQFATTFGDFADEVEAIDVNGLTTQLGELAISLGVDDEAMLQATTRAGALFQTFGTGQRAAAGFTESLSAAAAVITSVNPAAGDLTSVLDRLTTAVATGKTRGLKNLGIEITPAEIEAAANAIGKTTTSLTATERQAILVDEIMGKLTGRFGEFGDEIASRQENAQVKLAATKERVNNLIEALSVQVAVPMLEILTEMSPLIESLIPLAVGFGKALAFGVRIGADALSLLVFAIGRVAEGFGHILDELNDLPIIGRAIPNDLGEKLFTWGENAMVSADKIHDASRSGGDLNATLNATTPAANNATGAIAGLTGATTALTPAQEEAAAATKELVDSSISALPTSAAAFDAWSTGIKDAYTKVVDAAEETPDKVKAARDALNVAADPATLVANIQKQIESIGTFSTNLQKLVEKGMGNVVEFLAKKGPEAAGALAQSLVDNEANAAALNTTLGDLDTAYAGYETFIESEGGPAVAASAAESARLAAQAFSDNLLLTPKIQSEIEASKVVLADLGNGITITAGESAQRTSDAWSEKFQTKPHTEEELGATKTVIEGDTALPGAAGTLGTTTSGSYKGGLALDTATAGSLALAKEQFGPTGTAGVEGEASTAGGRIGGFFATGIATGMGSPAAQAAVRRSAQDLVRIAAEGVDVIALLGSPSKLFAEKGRDMAAGLALGMDQNAKTVEKSAQNLVGVSVGAFSDVALQAPQLQPSVASAARVGGAGGINNSTLNFDVTVNVNGAMGPAAAQAAAETFASEAEIALMRRNVIARVRAV